MICRVNVDSKGVSGLVPGSRFRRLKPSPQNHRGGRRLLVSCLVLGSAEPLPRSQHGPAFSARVSLWVLVLIKTPAPRSAACRRWRGPSPDRHRSRGSDWISSNGANRGKPTRDRHLLGGGRGPRRHYLLLLPGFVVRSGALVMASLAGVGCYLGRHRPQARVRLTTTRSNSFGVHAVAASSARLLTGVFAVSEFSGHSRSFEGDVGQFSIRSRGCHSVHLV